MHAIPLHQTFYFFSFTLFYVNTCVVYLHSLVFSHTVSVAFPRLHFSVSALTFFGEYFEVPCLLLAAVLFLPSFALTHTASLSVTPLPFSPILGYFGNTLVTS